MSRVVDFETQSNFDRWPASLHPDWAERCYYPARVSSFTWVDGLRTRNGIPRWHRIRRCGDPAALVRISDGAVSWEPTWCKDRACYACARSRSRKIAECLRIAIELKPDAVLYFVTLTQPRIADESADDGFSRFVRQWEALRHLPFWKENIEGGVRTMEVTYSQGHARARNRVPGWHVHAHLCVEVLNDTRVDCPTCKGTTRYRGQGCETCGSAATKSDGTMAASARAMIREWCNVVGGNVAAQCAVPINRTNVGQLAKYVTKLWELKPPHARELFAAIAGRQLVSGFGTWATWRGWGTVESTPRGWYRSTALRQIETFHPDHMVSFDSTLPGVALVAGGEIHGPVRGVVLKRHNVDPYAPAWRPTVAVAAMRAADVLAAIKRDPRPVWDRKDEHPPQHVERCAAVRAMLSKMSRTNYVGNVQLRRIERASGRPEPPGADRWES